MSYFHKDFEEELEKDYEKADFSYLKKKVKQQEEDIEALKMTVAQLTEQVRNIDKNS